MRVRENATLFIIHTGKHSVPRSISGGCLCNTDVLLQNTDKQTPPLNCKDPLAEHKTPIHPGTQNAHRRCQSRTARPPKMSRALYLGRSASLSNSCASYSWRNNFFSHDGKSQSLLQGPVSFRAILLTFIYLIVVLRLSETSYEVHGEEGTYIAGFT